MWIPCWALQTFNVLLFDNHILYNTIFPPLNFCQVIATDQPRQMYCQYYGIMQIYIGSVLD